MQSKVTVIIPTYNRAKVIGRSLLSLERQTNKNFICFVIDDGSTDGTEKVVKEMMKRLSFPLEYFYKENGGVLDAVRFGLNRTKTELALINGSDDELTDDAIEKCLTIWYSLSEKERKKYGGIKAPSIDFSSHKIVGRLFPKNINQCNYKKYFFYDVGERCCLYRTKLIRKQFQEYKEVTKGTGFKFVPEGTLHYKYEMMHRYYCVNTPLRIYHQEDADSYTRRPLTRLSCKVSYFSHTYVLRTYFPNDKLPFKRQFQHALYAIKFGMLLKYKLSKIYGDVGNFSNKLVLTISLPFGIGNFLLGKKIQSK